MCETENSVHLETPHPAFHLNKDSSSLAANPRPCMANPAQMRLLRSEPERLGRDPRLRRALRDVRPPQGLTWNHPKRLRLSFPSGVFDLIAACPMCDCVCAARTRARVRPTESGCSSRSGDVFGSASLFTATSRVTRGHVGGLAILCSERTKGQEMNGSQCKLSQR